MKCFAKLGADQRNATQRNATLYFITYNTCLLQIYIFDVSTPKTVFFFLKQNIHLTVCVLSVELYLEKPFFFCYILKVGWFIINLVERGCVTYHTHQQHKGRGLYFVVKKDIFIWKFIAYLRLHSES